MDPVSALQSLNHACKAIEQAREALAQCLARQGSDRVDHINHVDHIDHIDLAVLDALDDAREAKERSDKFLEDVRRRNNERKCRTVHEVSPEAELRLVQEEARRAQEDILKVEVYLPIAKENARRAEDAAREPLRLARKAGDEARRAQEELNRARTHSSSITQYVDTCKRNAVMRKWV